MAAQGILLRLADIPTINADNAPVNVVKACEQIDDGSLARARRPHQRDCLAGLRPQAHILDHGHAGHVGKVNVVEDDLASDVVERDSAGRVGEFRLFVNHIEYPLRPGQRGLHLVVDVAQLPQWRSELTGVVVEGRDGTDCGPALECHPAPQPGEDSDVGVAQDAHQRRDQHRVGLRPDADLAHLLVGRVEIRQGGGLLPKRHDDPLPAEHFLQLTVQLADPHLVLAKASAGALPHEAHQPHHQREEDH